jgi:hypothetical protein
MTIVEQLVDVTGVEVIGDYRLRLSFADGTVDDLDFTGREWRGVFDPLRDPAYFARVKVDPEAGTIRWPDALDIAPAPLYDQAGNPADLARAANYDLALGRMDARTGGRAVAPSSTEEVHHSSVSRGRLR